MSYYSESELQELPFALLGKNVQISRKASLYNHEQLSIGDNTRIDDFCVISGKVTLGNNVHIAVFANLAGGEKGIHMDNFSAAAYSVSIFSQSDDYTGKTLTNPTIPDEYKHETKKSVYIGKHCIIGAHSCVFPGVNMGAGVAVGAMSLVARNVPPWKVVFGIPAKIVKDRKKDLLSLEEQYIKSYIK